MPNNVKTTALGRAIRTLRGLRSLRLVGQEIGVHYSSLHRIESDGRMPNPRDFLTIARWLGKLDTKNYERLRSLADETKS